MKTNSDPMRNVGTPGSPISWLHERTVAALYDGLTIDRVVVGQRNLKERGRRHNHSERVMRVRLTPGGELSHDLCEGVMSVKIPDPEWDIIGGIVPDIVLYGEDASKPIRVIEVIVSNPPDATKRQKIEKLRARGVDVVEIVVKSENDLRNLMEVTWTPVFAPRGRRGSNTRADDEVRKIIDVLELCSPELRVAFKRIMSQLEDIESLYPLSPDNPLRDKLYG